MQLKLFVLSGAAVVLWLAPLVGLDKQIGWHKGLQGISLCSAVACAVAAGNIAKHQADEDEIEAIKARAIKADVIDEISTSAYVSQTQRQQEAEQLLNPTVEHLERSLALTCEDDEHSVNIEHNQLAEQPTNTENERAERILELKAKGWGKGKIILDIWGLPRGGGAKYKAAEVEYHRIVDGEREE